MTRRRHASLAYMQVCPKSFCEAPAEVVTCSVPKLCPYAMSVHVMISAVLCINAHTYTMGPTGGALVTVVSQTCKRQRGVCGCKAMQVAFL